MESYNCYAIFLINIKMNSRRTKIAPSQRELANAIRALSMDAVEQAKSGHPGMPMGMADVATVLFTQFLKFQHIVSSAIWPYSKEL